jgi:hypothetical protein
MNDHINNEMNVEILEKAFKMVSICKPIEFRIENEIKLFDNVTDNSEFNKILLPDNDKDYNSSPKINVILTFI